MEKLSVLLLFSAVLGVSCEDLIPLEKEKFSLESSSVTLSYNYSREASAGDTFFWYQQYPGTPPQFLISHSGSGTPISDPVSRLSFQVSVSCEDLAPTKNEESCIEGSSVTLSYKSSKLSSGDYFFWYRQYPGTPPQFLISHSGSGTPISKPVPRLSFKVSEDKIHVNLQISSAAVTDSAVYYCAVKPTVTGNTKTLYKNH
ncbi:unnamed protein product [Xyrichtys novacula]|uniref:Unnamed protein product n=1 Tax=Xyrichtys novacula TaxID=13765 RepID=A0AAV1GIY0_XYRNO|nr:unnamed protein product [Xyrichtys novacula]